MDLSWFDWKMVLPACVITSIVVEGLNIITPKSVKAKVLLFVVAFLVTLFRLPWQFEELANIQAFGSNLVLTVCFSILFYTYLGKKTVKKMFEKFKNAEETSTELKKPDETSPETK